MKTVEKFDCKWNGEKWSFLLEAPVKRPEGGEVTRVTLRKPGAEDFVLEDLSLKKLSATVVRADSQKRSRYAAFLQLAPKPRAPAVVLEQAPTRGAPGEVLVVIPHEGGPKLVFREPLDIKHVTDLDKDRGMELVGNRERSECAHRDLCTYAPQVALKLDVRASPPSLVVSEPLSERANAKAGYPWAGLGKQAWVYKGRQIISEEEMQRILRPEK